MVNSLEGKFIFDYEIELSNNVLTLKIFEIQQDESKSEAANIKLTKDDINNLIDNFGVDEIAAKSINATLGQIWSEKIGNHIIIAANNMSYKDKMYKIISDYANRILSGDIDIRVYFDEDIVENIFIEMKEKIKELMK